jgi:hypothetical protein
VIGLDYPNLWEWEEFDPSHLLELMRGFAAPWWVAGGWALDLWLGRRTRDHEDLDVAVLRKTSASCTRRCVDGNCTTPPQTIGSCRSASVSGSDLRSMGCGHAERPTLHGFANSFSTSMKVPTGYTGVTRRCACRWLR